MKAKQIVTLTKTLPRIEPVNNACSYHTYNHIHILFILFWDRCSYCCFSIWVLLCTLTCTIASRMFQNLWFALIE